MLAMYLDKAIERAIYEIYEVRLNRQGQNII